MRVCLCVCVCVCMLFSHLKKNENLLFETTWMGLKGIMLGKISQRKTSTLWPHLYMLAKKTKKKNKIFKNPNS